jgi:TRAP-type C4-dicarboxylate transport system permease small subunit
MSEPNGASDDAHLDHMNDTGPWVWPAWLFMVIVAATVIEIVARYFIGAPTLWANELALFVCSLAFLWSGVYVMKRDEHLRINILYDMAPRWLRRIFDFISLLCVIIFCGGIAWFGAPTSWRALMNWERFGTAWNPPIPAVVKPAIIICAALMVALAIRNFLKKPKLGNPADSGTL